MRPLTEVSVHARSNGLATYVTLSAAIVSRREVVKLDELRFPESCVCGMHPIGRKRT